MHSHGWPGQNGRMSEETEGPGLDHQRSFAAELVHPDSDRPVRIRCFAEVGCDFAPEFSAFVDEGRTLSERLQAELGSEFKVVYHP
jgi:hypothetical protein